MKFRKSFVVHLEHNAQTIQMLESTDGKGVQFTIPSGSGGFTINAEEAEFIVKVIDPYNYGQDGFRYKRDEDEPV